MFKKKKSKSNEGTKIQNNESKNKEISLFYKEQNVILEEFKDVKTPMKPIEKLHRIIKPKKKKQNGDYGISISYYDDTVEFIKTSYKLRSKTHPVCEMPPFQSYYPSFSQMNNKQLNWYLYWRDRVTNGEYPETDVSYIYVFAYELINYSFNSNTAFNISMLKRLYEAYQDLNQVNRIQVLIADMLFESGEIELGKIYYQPTPTVPALYKQLQQKEHDLSRISITPWKSYILDHRFGTSKFFEPNKHKIYKTFKSCIHLLEKHTEEAEGKKLIDVYFETRVEKYQHHFFGGTISTREYYGNSFEFELDNIYPTTRLYTEVLEYFRLCENVTRILNGEKRQIKCDESVLPDGLRQEMMKVMTAPKDKGRFKTVQNGSKNNQGSAIPAKEREEESLPKIEIQFDDKRIQQLTVESNILVDEVEKRALEYENDSNNQEILDEGKTNTQQLRKESSKETNITTGLENFLFSLGGDVEEEEMEIFVSELSNLEADFLRLFKDDLSCPKEDATQFLKAKGSILGVVMSQLNEKAQEYLEDNLLEEDGDSLSIYEEFKTVLNIVKGQI